MYDYDNTAVGAPEGDSRVVPVNKTRSDASMAASSAEAAPLLPQLAAGFVPRQEILHKVFTEPMPRVILLQGPAGHGKTTLMQQIRSVVEAQGGATGWLSLDEGDNDLSRLFDHLQALLGTVEAQCTAGRKRAAKPTVAAGRAPRSDWMVGRLEQLEGRVALFFDEFQVLHSKSILGFFRNLFERLPENASVVIGSRTVPEIGLARLVVSHNALILRAQDLRFSQDEAKEFFAGTDNLGLSDQELEAIYGRSEGWPAALQLYRLSLASPSVRQSLSDIAAFRPRELADYLADNVLGLQSAEVQDFLRRTALLRRLCGPLCDAVLEREDSQQMLLALERGGLFLRSLDSDNQWFKYHTLFSSFLAEQLREQGTETVRQVHERAAWWFADNGLYEDAMHHAIAARDYSLAADVLDTWSTQLIMDAKLMTVERWYDRLSLDEVEARPDLLVKVAYALAFLRRRQKLGPIQAMLERLADSGDRATRAKVSVVRSMLLIIQDDILGAREVIDTVDLFDYDSANFRAFELGAGANLQGYLGIAAGDGERAHEYLSLARAHSERAGAAFSWGYSVSTAGVNQMMQGMLQEALEKFRQCMAEPRVTLDESVAVAALVACYVQALYETNALDEAAAQFEQFHDVIRNAALLDYMAAAFISQARIHDARGKPGLAQECLDEGESIAHASNWPRMLRIINWERVRRAVVRDELDRAHSIASRIPRSTPPRPEGWLPFSEDCEGDAIGMIRLEIADGRAERALGELAQELRAATALGRVRRQLKLHILEALAHHRLGADKQALRAMQRAVHLAEPRGFIRTFLEEGPAVGTVLEGLRQGLSGGPVGKDDAAETLLPFIDKLLEVAGVEHTHSETMVGAAFEPLEPLTERERQILVLLASGAANRQIAERIFVSENTVKFHLKNIYSKLGVNNRAQAIRAAHQMHLL